MTARLSRRGRTRFLALFTAITLGGGVACTPPQPAPTPVPTRAAAAPPTAGPSPATAPAAAGSPVASASPQGTRQAFDAAAWDQTVAAAKREGKIVISGPVGEDVREALIQGFQRKYPEIQVDYSGLRGAEQAPKILTEMGASQFLSDLVVAGTTTIITSLMPAGAVQPAQLFLVGPETRDLSPWKGGKLDFADQAGQYNLAFANRIQIPFVYNTQVFKASDFTTWTDLLKPAFKGKIVMLDPRRAGTGLDIVTFWYTTPSLGKEFARQFFAQEVTVLNDDRQILDAAASGKQPIAVGPSGVLSYEMKGKGLPIDLLSGEALKEGSFVTASNGSVGVLKQAPHPNAVKVYLDYLLSRQGQTEWAKATGVASRRTDVPSEGIPEFLVPKPGATYQENYKENLVTIREEIIDFLKTVMG